MQQRIHILVFDAECKWLCIYLFLTRWEWNETVWTRSCVCCLSPLFPLHSAAHQSHFFCICLKLSWELTSAETGFHDPLKPVVKFLEVPIFERVTSESVWVLLLTVTAQDGDEDHWIKAWIWFCSSQSYGFWRFGLQRTNKIDSFCNYVAFLVYSILWFYCQSQHVGENAFCVPWWLNDFRNVIHFKGLV